MIPYITLNWKGKNTHKINKTDGKRSITDKQRKRIKKEIKIKPVGSKAWEIEPNPRLFSENIDMGLEGRDR